jgi:hypothetical protein
MNAVCGFKTAFFLALFCFFIMPTAFSQGVPLDPVSVAKVPASVEEFISLRDRLGKTPQGGAAVLLLAMIIYSNGSTLGEQCLVLSLDISQLVEGETYNGYALSARDRRLLEKYIGKDSGQAYLPKSYVSGTHREEGYALPAGKLTFHFFTGKKKKTPDSTQVKVFVECSGTDSPRPIIIARNSKGIWKAVNWRSLVISIKPPPGTG